MVKRFRLLLWLILALLCIPVHGRTILPEEAQKAAKNFFGESAFENKSLKIKGLRSNIEGSSERPFYIFNSTSPGNGFVIVSGDDRMPQILGYSKEGRFDTDNIPPQLQSILEGVAENFRNITGMNEHPSWKNSSRVDDTGILLHTAEWDQTDPYNLYAPEIKGVKAPSGCVAAAMAIVMQYHKWPNHGYSWDIQPKDFSNINFNSDGNVFDNLQIKRFEDYIFNYSKMPDKLTDKSTMEQKQAVSLLMDAAAKAVRSNYGEIETSAYFQVVCHEMLEKFSYSPECELLMASDYEWEEWLSIARSQIDRSLPVMYCGTGGDGRHAYVLDGYNNDGYFHINWGWGGSANGYFQLEMTKFPSQPQMVINAIPDKSETKYSRVYSSKDDIYTLFEETDVMLPSVENIEKGVKFDISYPTLRYFGTQNFSLASGLVDKDGNLKEISENPMVNQFGAQYYLLSLFAQDGMLKQQEFKSDVQPSDYVQFFTKDEGSDEWLPVNGCTRIPTRISVIGNKPKKTTVHFDIDHDDIYLRVRDGINQDKILFDTYEKPISELQFVRGETIVLDMFVRDGRNGYSIGKVHGKYAYGDMQTQTFDRKEPFVMSFKMMDEEYTVEAKLMNYAPPVTVQMAEAGKLNEMIPLNKTELIGELSVSGPVNAWDLWYIHDNMYGIRKLDLSKANIEECSTPDHYILGFPVSPVQNANTLPDWSFDGLNVLSTVKLPETLEQFGNLSVSGTAIREIIIPEKVDWMGTNTFFMCQKLETIVSKNPTPPSALDCIIDSWSKLLQSGTLYVPDQSVEAYKQAETWNKIPNIRPISQFSGIEDILKHDGPKQLRIYDMYGRLLGDNLDALPHGVYIVNNGSGSWKVLK